MGTASRLGGLRKLRHLADRSELDDEAEQVLLEGLTATSSAWRLAALQGLVRHGSTAALPMAERLLELKRETDPFLLATLQLVLAGNGKGDLDDLARRATGRRGLIHEGPWPPRPHLARRIGEGWPLRRLAVQALGCTDGGRDVLRQVIAADPDWAVREEAVHALGTPLDDVERAALKEAREDPSRPVRVAAARALGGEGLGLASDPDERFAWRVPGSEPYFRYLSGVSRQEYGEELNRATRNGPGRNWATFGILCDLDLGDRPPPDVNPHWRLIRALGVDASLTMARDLLHHPSIAWGEDPLWPVCCNDFAIFYGHNLDTVCPPGLELELWFLESLVPEMPLPDCKLPELEADTYAFRCGYCGAWYTTYEPDL